MSDYHTGHPHSIQNCFLMADLPKMYIFKKIHVAAQKWPYLSHFLANLTTFLHMEAKNNK